MSGFQSPPYRVLHQAHTRINNYIKLSIAAVDHLFNFSEGSKVLSEKINQLVIDAGERWTPRIFSRPENDLLQLKNDLTKSGIFWVYSAFDVYFKKTEGLLSSRFPEKNTLNVNKCEVCGKQLFEERDEEREHKVVELYQKLDWDITAINKLLPILQYFQAMRHSIAHNMGIPNGKLPEIADSNDFNLAIENWETKFDGRNISPTPVVADGKIELKPHHAILYSEVCLRIAKDMDKHILQTFTSQKFIDETIQKHLLSTGKLSEPRCSNLNKYVKYHLLADFGINIKNDREVLEEFEEAKIKSFKKRYFELSGVRRKK